MKLDSDKPIKEQDEDQLDRLEAAKSFGKIVSSLDLTEGVVVGVMGNWGSGKTSFINLARPHLDASNITIVDFNPWMFSGSEQLVEAFFVEVSAQLKVKPSLKEIGDKLADYGESFSKLSWLPVVGPWISRMGFIARFFKSPQKEAVSAKKEKIAKVMRKMEGSIGVVLDDIDRLSTKEIRDVFRMVRLTANFPNLIYIVAFDRKRVESALGEDGVQGREYLEKILQHTVDLPLIPDHVLAKQIFQCLEKAMQGIENQRKLDDDRWPDVYYEVVRPLVKNVRDAKRYALAVRGAMITTNGKVDQVDVLALESIRIFLPDVFEKIGNHMVELTSCANGRDSTGGLVGAGEKAREILSIEEDYRDVVKSLINRIFPGGNWITGDSNYGAEWQKQWLKSRRCAHPDILRFYMQGIVGAPYQAFLDGERAFSLIGDEEQFDRFMRDLNNEDLEDVIESLESFEEDFKVEHVCSGVTVLLNLYPDLPERPVHKRGFYDIGTKLKVTRVTLRLLRSVEDPAKIAELVASIYPKIKTISMKWELISDIGYQEGCGHKLVSEGAAADFERMWLNDFRQSTLEQLCEEPELFYCMRRAYHLAEQGETLPEIHEDPKFTRQVLSTAISQATSQSIDSHKIDVEDRISWDGLVELYGSESTVNLRVKELDLLGDPEDEKIISLANKYLSGWRPE